MFVTLNPNSSSQAVPGSTTSAKRRAVSFTNKSTQTTSSTLSRPLATWPASANDDSMLVPSSKRTFKRPLDKASVISGIWCNVVARWTPFRRAHVTQACALRPMTRPKSASRKAKIASQCRQAADRTRGMPTVGALVHGTAAKQDHGRSRGGVGLSERDYLACLKTRLFCRPCGSEGQTCADNSSNPVV